MRIVLTGDPSEFATRAQPFLTERLECNVLATVLQNVLEGLHTARPPLFAYGLASSGEVGCAALRTPPWSMLASGFDSSTANRLMEAWLHEDPGVPGANGPRESVREIAAAWARRTGAATYVTMREVMHALEHVDDPPRPAPGELRAARASERATLVGWMRAFLREAGLAGVTEAEAAIDHRLERGRLLVWDDGEPVSLVGVAPAVAGVVRIGPVYTPPDRRRRGYASSAVAHASRLALARGAQRCMLFTDMSNPTSNKIYADVGFRRFGDWEEHEFG